MTKISSIKAAAMCGACTILLSAAAASARDFNIPSGDLESALDSYTAQTGVALIVSNEAIHGIRTKGVQGDLTADDALTRLLSGTGFTTRRTPAGAVGIVRTQTQSEADVSSLQLAQAAPARASVETVTVTSSKLGGADVQSIPIAITALSQEQLTSTQTAGGPDLVKNVPNLTFTKTNFTGYSIQIRGIGTQAISVTTDPAVAVAFNDTPFIRNHFFEQEFFDVSQVEVLRGPQGTLYGRNATAGVVNLVSAKPTDQYEAMASVDVGNYNNRRLEGMLNIPIAGDKLAIRAAGEWTKRDGYSFNSTTDRPVDGRDLWSSRLTVGLHPTERLQAYLVWEHFSEDDDRMRTAKQLCKKDPGPNSVDGLDITALQDFFPNNISHQTAWWQAFLSQGCSPASFYSKDAFQTPNGQAIPIVFADEFVFNGFGDGSTAFLLNQVDPYASKTQSRNLRVIESEISPKYGAKNDTLELNVTFDLMPSLTLISQTGYNKDELNSTEDFNRFNTAPGLIATDLGVAGQFPPVTVNGVYCDPQVGCSDKMVGEDLSREHATQFNQELRLASKFEGPFNFSVGANYTHYHTVEDYFVFLNLLTLTSQKANNAPLGDFTHCYETYPTIGHELQPVTYFDPSTGLAALSSDTCNHFGTSLPGTYIDPNPISNLNGLGHNYFRSENPYTLNSWAGFGEAYYQMTQDVKLTAGLRWTDDRKKFWNIPSWTFLQGGGYPVLGIVNQEWKEWTGRFNATWTPKLDFTDQSMFYASYSRGYKGGGANPPPPVAAEGTANVTHPATFDPEFVNAYEIGTKNTLLDSAMTLNATAFYYDYKGYQISQIVDRTSINLNFDAKVKGAEVEATWEPLPGLRFNLSGGLEDSSVNKGQSAIDLMDRTAGHSDWLVVKPFVSETSNCIFPTAVIREIIEQSQVAGGANLLHAGMCDIAYSSAIDDASRPLYLAFLGAPDYDPSTAPNGGAGFSKDLSGNKLPNTPPFTLSAGAQYSVPISADWAGTLRGDFYWQGNSFARIFNDKPYDQLHGYTNVNLALIFTNQDGWQAMLYAKNVFDTTAITGAFLNSDDTALTTNVFLTDPRLFGIRITKNW
jgi:outer membrane receptor protein involved in Fe transport